MRILRRPLPQSRMPSSRASRQAGTTGNKATARQWQGRSWHRGLLQRREWHSRHGRERARSSGQPRCDSTAISSGHQPPGHVRRLRCAARHWSSLPAALWLPATHEELAGSVHQRRVGPGGRHLLGREPDSFFLLGQVGHITIGQPPADVPKRLVRLRRAAEQTAQPQQREVASASEQLRLRCDSQFSRRELGSLKLGSRRHAERRLREQT